MATKRYEEIRQKRLSAERIAKNENCAHEELLEMDLRAIRELVGKTQVEVAEEVEISQAQISRIETQRDHRISVLQRYLAALGGHLDVYAHIGDRLVKLY
jgi:DNA-binding XRE family transcriptional regulator